MSAHARRLSELSGDWSRAVSRRLEAWNKYAAGCVSAKTSEDYRIACDIADDLLKSIACHVANEHSVCYGSKMQQCKNANGRPVRHV